MAKFTSAILALGSLVGMALAQTASNSSGNDIATGCLGGCASIIIMWGILNVVLLFWVASDFKKRTGSTSVGWILLILIFGVIGLIIYLIARPAGSFVKCPKCAHDKIITMPICPHCGQKVIS